MIYYMKNKGLYILITILFIILVFCLLFYKKFTKYDIDKRLYNSIWYHYNYNDGTYSSIEFNGKQINYNNSSISNSDTCNKYDYNRKTNTFSLDCGISFEINEINDKNIVIAFKDKKEVYFNTIDESLNNEFKLYYSKTIDEAKKESNNVLDIIKVDYYKLNNYIDENNKTIFVFKGNKCTSIECFILNNVIEKWMSKSNNVFYINSESIKENVIFNIINREEYDSNYPFIIEYDKNSIVNKFYIKCDGFNCEKYYDLDI